MAEADIFPLPRGKLAAKLLVFATVNDLKRFWRSISHPLGRGCRGAVNALANTKQRVGACGGSDGSAVLQGDRRYFCVIGLCARHLSMEIVCHESVHAGFCYEKRVRRNPFGPATEFDEERIAYPAGAVAAAINRFLRAKGLYGE